MKEINVGIIGLGCRGKSNTETIINLKGIDINIVAICDEYEDRCDSVSDIITAQNRPAPFKTCNYKEILERKDINTVLVFSSWESHIPIAIEAIKKGFAVGLEVGGAYSIDECRELVEAWEETKVPFMLLENCCFGKTELMITKMVRDNMFGDIVMCHGAYAHDLREEVSHGNINRHYRLRNYLSRNCENYPTHELGPIAKLLDINRGNKMNRLLSTATKASGIEAYITNRKETFEDKDLIGKKFMQADIVNTVIECENGETITLTLDTCLPRSYSREFEIRGTKGMYSEDFNSVFIDGDKEYWTTEDYINNSGNNTKQFEEKYASEYWKNITQEEIDAGHGGMDVYCFKTFFNCLKKDEPMPVDVYDAAAWMAITPLSEISLKNNNCWVEIPDFTNGLWKTRPRMDID